MIQAEQDDDEDSQMLLPAGHPLLTKRPSLGAMGVVSSSVSVPFSALMPSLRRRVTRQQSFPGLDKLRPGVPVEMRRQSSAPQPARPKHRTKQ